MKKLKGFRLKTKRWFKYDYDEINSFITNLNLARGEHVVVHNRIFKIIDRLLYAAFTPGMFSPCVVSNKYILNPVLNSLDYILR